MKYIRVINGINSHANGFEFKIGEVNVSENWNPKADNPLDFGGFNFSKEDKILRYLHRGDTLYDVEIPKDACIVEVESENAPHGIFRANKIIVSNPRLVTDDLVIQLYKKSTLPEKTYYQCLVTLLYKNHIEAVKYIIKDRINKNNVDDAINEFERFVVLHDNKKFSYDELWDDAKEIYDILKEIQSDLLISLYVSKEPFEKVLTNDNVINLTGQSGSGKSYYAKENFNTDQYLIIDTDDIFSEKRFEKALGINKELGQMFRNKYEILPNLSSDFDLIYEEIINYCKDIKKTLVIDCAQFHCVKDISGLKGKIIIIRTCIDTCYQRCIERYKKNNINVTEDEIKNFSLKKKAIFTWYKQTNEFIKKIDNIK